MITKYMLTSIEIIIKLKLIIESIPKANERLKSRVLCFKRHLQHRVTREKKAINNKKLWFSRVLLDQLGCA